MAVCIVRFILWGICNWGKKKEIPCSKISCSEIGGRRGDTMLRDIVLRDWGKKKRYHAHRYRAQRLGEEEEISCSEIHAVSDRPPHITDEHRATF
jgi:hypothetical protein